MKLKCSHLSSYQSFGWLRSKKGDENLPSYVGIINKTMKEGTHKDPYKTTRIPWKVGGVAWGCERSFNVHATHVVPAL